MSSYLTSSELFTIGFVGNEKKNKQFFEPFVNYCNTIKKEICNCVEIKIENSDQMNEQPCVDVLFFKVTDDMVIESLDPSAHQRLENLRQYISREDISNKTAIVESLEDTSRFLDRTVIHNFLEQQLQDNDYVKVPKMYFINSKDEDLSRVDSKSFPLVCKTVAACGKSETHHMAIVFNQDQFEKVVRGENTDSKFNVATPLVAQQFINHDSTLYKVYVIGERVFYQIKPSLKNFDLEAEQSIISFDSQKPFESAVSDSTITESKLQEVDYSKLNQEGFDKMFKQVSDQLRKALNVSLFGFDLVRDTNSKAYHVVDVNYFPSYKGVSREILFDYLIEHLSQRVQEKRRN